MVAPGGDQQAPVCSLCNTNKAEIHRAGSCVCHVLLKVKVVKFKVPFLQCAFHPGWLWLLAWGGIVAFSVGCVYNSVCFMAVHRRACCMVGFWLLASLCFAGLGLLLCPGVVDLCGLGLPSHLSCLGAFSSSCFPK